MGVELLTYRKETSLASAGWLPWSHVGQDPNARPHVEDAVVITVLRAAIGIQLIH